MQLTGIQLLDTTYTQTDAHEIAAVNVSTIGGTPISALRWADVDRNEAEHSLRQAITQTMKSQFDIERISGLGDSTEIPRTDRAERLVVRDLDLTRLDTSDPEMKPGRIVASGDWRYWAAYGVTPSSSSSDGDEKGSAITDRPASTLGRNGGLQTLLDTRIQTTLDEVFHGLPLFGLLGIATLTPSHLRKGIAKRITQWIFPYADRMALPVVLYASPVGLPLYRRCEGVVEYPELDAIVDLGEWGGEGVHHHSMMIRWPREVERLPVEWKRWREKYGEGVVFEG